MPASAPRHCDSRLQRCPEVVGSATSSAPQRVAAPARRRESACRPEQLVHPPQPPADVAPDTPAFTTDVVYPSAANPRLHVTCGYAWSLERPRPRSPVAEVHDLKGAGRGRAIAAADASIPAAVARLGFAGPRVLGTPRIRQGSRAAINETESPGS
jgi:hypothetical protein